MLLLLLLLLLQSIVRTFVLLRRCGYTDDGGCGTIIMSWQWWASSRALARGRQNKQTRPFVCLLL